MQLDIVWLKDDLMGYNAGVNEDVECNIAISDAELSTGSLSVALLGLYFPYSSFSSLTYILL